MELEFPTIPMERTGKTLRKSIHFFLRNYHFFTTTPALIAFPFSLSALLSQSLIPFSSLLPTVQSHLLSLSYAAGFPPSSQFSSLLILKLSQAITSSILVLPFTLFSLLISKSVTIQFLKNHQKAPTHSIFHTYTPMLLTQICNFFLIIAANSTCFSFLFISFNSLEALGLSSPNSTLLLSAIGAALYSIVLANALIISNMAVVLSGTEKNSGGYLAILKACNLIRGRTAAALALAVPVNLALAAVDLLFRYRVMEACYEARSFNSPMALEGIFIAYLYSVIIVIDTIISYVFYEGLQSSLPVRSPEEVLLSV